jgi:F0F1-type ATP synthase assembly protein I
MVAAMADDGSGNKKSGGKGALGDLVKAESMIQLAIALPAGCVIGWLIGAWLDKHFNQGWMGIVGILLGAAAGFMQIFMTASRYLKRDR